MNTADTDTQLKTSVYLSKFSILEALHGVFFIFRQVHIHAIKEEVGQLGIVLFCKIIYSKIFLLAGFLRFQKISKGSKGFQKILKISWI